MGDRGTILVVTADEAVFDLTARLFERGGYAVSRAPSGEESLVSIKNRRPSLVVLDADLPDMSGYEICFELREQIGDNLPIVFLSHEESGSSDRVAGLLIGADDVVAKPFDPDELLARVRRILSRVPRGRQIADVPLTGREVEVLELLARGLNPQRIASELFISPKTVGTHVQRILTKLGVHSRSEAVGLAYRYGLVESEERLSKS